MQSVQFFQGILDIMMYSMTLIIMQNGNPPKYYLYIFNRWNVNKAKSTKNHCTANAALKSGGLTKNNRGQKWYQSIALFLSFYRKKFHRFLFSRHLVIYIKTSANICTITTRVAILIAAFSGAIHHGMRRQQEP